MGRSWRYAVVWMAATAAAVTVSWLGVQVGVAPALTAESPVAIDVDRRYTEVRLGPPEAVAESAAPGAVVPPPVGGTPAAIVRSTPPSPSPAVSTPSEPTRSRPTRTPSVGPSASAAASRRPPVAPASAAVTPVPTRAAAPDRRPRYRIPAQGGVVTVAYSATRVDVVDADPAPGYSVGVDRRGERLLVIRLTGPTHASVVTAYWLGGPGARIMEEFAR